MNDFDKFWIDMLLFRESIFIAIGIWILILFLIISIYVIICDMFDKESENDG